MLNEHNLWLMTASKYKAAIDNNDDALEVSDKPSPESQTDKSKLDAQPELFIHIVPDKAANNNDICMFKPDLLRNLGTTARSATKVLMEGLAAGTNVPMIARFSMGYLVAEIVVVTAKHNDEQQYVWESRANG